MDVFVGNTIHTPAYGKLEFLINYALCVDSSGDINFLMPFSAFEAQRESMDINSITVLSETQFLFPGFIDTHIHAPQFPNCGIFGDSTLLDWLNTYTFPLEGKFNDLEMAKAVYNKVIDRQIQNGTTFSSYFGTIYVESTVELAKICQKKGVRAYVGRVCMERNCPEYYRDGTLESDIKFCDAIASLDPNADTIKAVITPRFAPTCEFNTLKALGKLAKERSLPIQTHLSENHREIEWVKELFPDIANYTSVYDKSNLLNENTILAHSIHLSQEEQDLIKERGSGISHCPNSNASIASGVAPVKHYLETGLKVSLGSDCSGGSTVSILKNTRLALLMSRLLSERDGNSQQHLLTVADGLFLATLGGAQVMNLQSKLGSFQVGKKFDAQLIDIAAPGSAIDLYDDVLPSKTPEMRLEHLVHKWVYIGDDRNTTKVWVNGKQIYSI